MKLKGRFYMSLSKLLPRAYVKFFEQTMKYSGEEQNALYYLGSSVLFSLLILIIIIVGGYYYTTYPMHLVVLSAIGCFIVLQLLYYLVTFFKMERRVDQVESFLPDQLQLMSNNIKSGMTPFHALKNSAREDFGPLSEEILNAVNKALSSRSFTDALLDIKSRIKSVVLERVLKLEVSSFKRGTKLSILLNELADDIRHTRALRRELLTKTKTYTAFILFTVLLGTPVLLSISIHFVTMISGFSAITDVGSGQDFGLGFFSEDVGIEPDFLIKLSYVMLTLTTILASMLLGVFQKGKALSGLKYAPALIVAAFIIFTAARYFITNFFGTVI